MAFPMRDHTIPPMSSRRFQSPSVIPDIFNRESMAFPMQDHTNEGTEEKDSGFPLKTSGNDRVYDRAGLVYTC